MEISPTFDQSSTGHVQHIVASLRPMAREDADSMQALELAESALGECARRGTESPQQSLRSSFLVYLTVVWLGVRGGLEFGALMPSLRETLGLSTTFARFARAHTRWVMSLQASSVGTEFETLLSEGARRFDLLAQEAFGRARVAA